VGIWTVFGYLCPKKKKEKDKKKKMYFLGWGSGGMVLRIWTIKKIN
jgi:hypothetical protein